MRIPVPSSGSLRVQIQISGEQVRYLLRKWADPHDYREFVNQTEQLDVWETEGGALQC